MSFLRNLYRGVQNLLLPSKSSDLCHHSLFPLAGRTPARTTMDLPYSRFPQELIGIIQAVAESHFVAFDLEFSGVAGRRPTGKGGKLSLQEYYEDIKAAAEKYQILQVGLTIVKEDSHRGMRSKSSTRVTAVNQRPGRYVAQPYNFNISPLPTLRERHFGREWSFHSGGQCGRNCCLEVLLTSEKPLPSSAEMASSLTYPSPRAYHIYLAKKSSLHGQR